MPRRTLRPFAPNPVPMATCTACGHLFAAREPDPGCSNPVAVPVSVLIADGRCETCYRRGVDRTTVGAVNVKEAW